MLEEIDEGEYALPTDGTWSTAGGSVGHEWRLLERLTFLLSEELDASADRQLGHLLAQHGPA